MDGTVAQKQEAYARRQRARAPRRPRRPEPRNWFLAELMGELAEQQPADIVPLRRGGGIAGYMVADR